MTLFANNQQKLSFREAITHCGVRFDVFKSALQKCCRRCEKDDITWFIQEIMCMTMLSDPEDKVAKGKITNIVNRLKVIAIEDVSPRCVQDIVYLDYFLSKWEESNKTDANHLANICWILCNTKKLRICSHLRMICHPDSTTFLATDELWDKLSLEFLTRCIRKVDRKFTIFVLGLYYRKMLGLDVNFNIVDVCFEGKISTSAKKKQVFSSFWNHLKSLCPDNCKYLLQNLSFKQKFFESRDYFREEFLCLISAVEAVKAVLLGLDLPPIEIPKSLGVQAMSCEEHSQPIFGNHVYDCHVSKGNRSIEFFLNEGALVMNEDLEWSLKDMEELYRRIRLSTLSHSRKRKREQKINNIKRRKYTQMLEFVKETICQNKFLDLQKYNLLTVCTPNSRKGISLAMKRNDDDDGNDGIASDIFIVKHMKKSINYGIDQLACHDIKHQNLFELPSLYVPNNMAASLYWSDISYCKENKTFQKRNKDENIYMVMSCVGDGIKDVRVTHNSEKAFQMMQENVDALQSIISIIIFRSILGVTDTNFSNILFDDKRMYSIDENSIGSYSCEKILDCNPVQRIIKQVKKRNLDRSLTKFFPLWLKSKNDKDRVMKRVMDCLRHYKISDDRIKVVEKNFSDIIPCLQKLNL